MGFLIDGGMALGATLKEEIESIRESMIRAALKKGLSDKETMKLSQKLDDVMNKYSLCEDAKDYVIRSDQSL